MPPKKGTTKLVAKKQKEESDSEHSEHEEQHESVAESDTEKEKEKEKVQVEKKQLSLKNKQSEQGWDKKSISDDKHVEENNDDQECQEGQEGQECQEDQEGQEDQKGAQKGAKYGRSAINFDYSKYTELTKPVNELNTTDLLKVAIVRSFTDNQYQLCKTLKQTLRAMNLECDFPDTSNVRQQPGRFGTRGRGGSQQSSFRNQQTSFRNQQNQQLQHPPQNSEQSNFTKQRGFRSGDSNTGFRSGGSNTGSRSGFGQRSRFSNEQDNRDY